MWAAIRSDLQEFVSGVAEETEVVLQSNATSPGGHRRGVDDEGEVLGDDYDATGVISGAADEVMRLQDLEETYSEPLDEGDESVQAFLDDFKIDSYTDTITKLLEENPDTIKVHFEALVPTDIAYELFWQRYFYRCNEERIEEEWRFEEKARRDARVKAISGGIKSVTNLFGGALSAVSATLEKADSSGGDAGGVPMSPFIDNGQVGRAKSTGGGINLFGTGGRPPFVMNTAVDEDGEEEEEEEEELGWDDDDDEEFEDGEEEGEDDAADMSEEITFSGGNNDAVNKLSEELVQALSERDALKETIALQNKEIAALKDEKAESKEVNRLEMKLFEKDAELAALKASLEDTHDDDAAPKKHTAKISSLERDVESLTKELEETKEECAKAKEVAADIEAELTSAEKVAAEQEAELKVTKKTLKETLVLLTAAQEEVEALRHLMGNDDEFAVAKQEIRDNAKAMETELEASRAECASLRAALESNDGMAAAEQEARDMAKVMDAELADSKETLAAEQKRRVELQQEVDTMKQSIIGSSEELVALAAEYSATKQELAAIQKHASDVEAELAKKLAASQKRASDVEAELAKALAASQKRVSDLEAALAKAKVEAERSTTPPSVQEPPMEPCLSPGSNSTGVKVDEAAPSVPADEEEEGWGDEWGSDDEDL